MMNTEHERANDSTDTLKEAIAIDGWTDGPDGDDGTNSQTNSYYAADGPLLKPRLPSKYLGIKNLGTLVIRVL